MTTNYNSNFTEVLQGGGKHSGVTDGEARGQMPP